MSQTSDPFAGFEVVSTYTVDDMIEDGGAAELPDDPQQPLAGVPLFDPGRVVTTPGALEPAGHAKLVERVNRHVCGDWGDLEDTDKRKNDRAVRGGEDRIFSAYLVDG